MEKEKKKEEASFNCIANESDRNCAKRHTYTTSSYYTASEQRMY